MTATTGDGGPRFTATLPPASSLRAPEDLLKFLHCTGAAAVVLFGLLFLVLGHPIPAIIEWVYALATASTLIWLHLWNGPVRLVVWLHCALGLCVSVAICCSLGGLFASGGFLVWGFISPAAALIFLGRPAAIVVSAGFVLAVGAAGLAEPWLTGVPPLSPRVRGPFAAANIIGSAALVLSTIMYFVDRLKQEQQEREEALKRARRLDRALVSMAKRTALSGRDLDRAVAEILDIARQELSVGEAIVWLYEDEGRLVRFATAGSLDGVPEPIQTVDVETYPRYFELLGGERILAVDDAMDDDRTREFIRDFLEPLAIRALLAVPLRGDGDVEGIVVLAVQHQARTWSREEISFMGAVGDLIAQIRAWGARQQVEAERATLEDRLVQAQKLESLGALAGGIAHDFNNLLVGILGRADLAASALDERGRAGEERALDHLDAIATSGRRAAELCEQLLAYSGRGHFVIEPMDVNEVVRDVSRLMEVSVSKKSTLTFQPGRELPWVEGDATQIRQVIMNLISNASEALDAGVGTIRVSTGRTECTAEQLARMDHAEGGSGTYVFLEVSDQGHGMTEETRARLFDPFYSTRMVGRGLGLATVLGIVRGHQGAIRVTSKPGEGTTLRVLLPARDWTPAEQPEETIDVPPPQARGTVLLVDDEAVVRETVGVMLADAGFQVVTAADGLEGIEAFRDTPDRFTCVVLDLSMPRLDGKEALAVLRELDPQIPVVLSSGYSELEFRDQFGGDSQVGFLQKPFRARALVDAITALCGPGDVSH